MSLFIIYRTSAIIAVILYLVPSALIDNSSLLPYSLWYYTNWWCYLYYIGPGGQSLLLVIMVPSIMFITTLIFIRVLLLDQLVDCRLAAPSLYYVTWLRCLFLSKDLTVRTNDVYHPPLLLVWAVMYYPPSFLSTLISYFKRRVPYQWVSCFSCLVLRLHYFYAHTVSFYLLWECMVAVFFNQTTRYLLQSGRLSSHYSVLNLLTILTVRFSYITILYFYTNLIWSIISILLRSLYQCTFTLIGLIWHFDHRVFNDWLFSINSIRVYLLHYVCTSCCVDESIC
jgi:hypothetical protein